MSRMFDEKKLGALKKYLSSHVLSIEVENEIERLPKHAIIGLGQGGGRIAAELSRFDFPTFLFNSSKSDLDEHKGLIPDEKRIFTPNNIHTGIEGTAKDSKLGYEIAVSNKKVYQEVALNKEVLESDFIWLTVSLGGGTGNGALKVAIDTFSLVLNKVKPLLNNKVPLGIICSLPSKSEKGSAFRQNALAGMAMIQSAIAEGKIGSVLVIDNEKITKYYETIYDKNSRTLIDARTYSNIFVASSLLDIFTVPLLPGRSVIDKAELLDILSTPGYLNVTRFNEQADNSNDVNYSYIVKQLFEQNEILASYDSAKLSNAIIGGTSIIYPKERKLSPKIADEVFEKASELLNTKIHNAVSEISNIKNLTIYGMAVLPHPPIRIQELREELDQWREMEKQQEEARKQAASSTELSEFDDFFKVANTPKQAFDLNNLNADDIFGENKEEEKTKAPTINFEELDF